MAETDLSKVEASSIVGQTAGGSGMQETGRMQAQRRLRQKDLVAMLFVLFSEEYDRTQAGSISEIELPMEELRQYLEQQTGIAYSGDAWIMTQIHKYEDEVGVELFRRTNVNGVPALALCRDMRTYEQKRHLYVTQKIRAANGVFDLILNASQSASVFGNQEPGTGIANAASGIGQDRRMREARIEKSIRHTVAEGFALAAQDTAPILRLLLEAGSTVTRVAGIIAGKLENLPYIWEISSHNLGVIESLGKTAPAFRRVSIFVPEGRFDPVTNLILGHDASFYLARDFDWIVQGSSFLSERVLAVESADETAIKDSILHGCRGRKVLVLTGQEPTSSIPTGAGRFGRIEDYDYIVHPALPRDSAAALRLARELGGPASGFSTCIRTWSYEILAREARG